jgi:hypothetical protein
MSAVDHVHGQLGASTNLTPNAFWPLLRLQYHLPKSYLKSFCAMRYPEASTSTALESSLSTASGSRTITVTVDPTQEVTEDTPSNHDSSEGTGTIGVIRLTGGRNSGPRVAWDEEVVDNEHMGKKKSKSRSTLRFRCAFDNVKLTEGNAQFVVSTINLGLLMSRPLKNRRRIRIRIRNVVETDIITTTTTIIDTGINPGNMELAGNPGAILNLTHTSASRRGVARESHRFRAYTYSRCVSSVELGLLLRLSFWKILVLNSF